MKVKHETLVDKNGRVILGTIKPGFGFFGRLIRNGKVTKL